MKTLIIAIGITVIMGVLVGMKGSSHEVINNTETIEVEKEVVVDALEVKIKEAQEAAKNEIEAKAQAAYDAAYNQEMKTIEAQVLKQVEEDIKTRRTTVEKETGDY